MVEQGGSHAKRMIFMGNRYRELGGLRVIADDDVIRYSDQPVVVECAESTSPMCGLGQFSNDFVELDRMQREESVVAIIVAEVLMQLQHRLGILGAEATQRHDPPIEQSSRSLEFHELVAHDPTLFLKGMLSQEPLDPAHAPLVPPERPSDRLVIGQRGGPVDPGPALG